MGSGPHVSGALKSHIGKQYDNSLIHLEPFPPTELILGEIQYLSCNGGWLKKAYKTSNHYLDLSCNGWYKESS